MAAEALEAVGLGERLFHKPAELSGGEQQRVAIARALITGPSLILADEPTGNLDSRTSLEILSIFQTLNRDRGITVIYVTHEAEIAEHAGRIIQMCDGLIVDDIRVGSPRWALEEMERLASPASALAEVAEAAEMSFLDAVQVAIEALIANKMRALLTMLGIVIGVGAVIALMAVGQGSQKAVTDRIEGLGSNLVFVRPGSSTQAGVSGGAGSAQTLSMEDAEAILAFVPEAVVVAPDVRIPLQVSGGGQNTFTRAAGVTADYAEAYELQVAEGAFISVSDVDQRSRVAVLGSSVAEQLFPDTSPLGEQIRLGLGWLGSLSGLLASLKPRGAPPKTASTTRFSCQFPRSKTKSSRFVGPATLRLSVKSRFRLPTKARSTRRRPRSIFCSETSIKLSSPT